MSENISSVHEVKAATRPVRRHLLGLARKGERLARLVKLEDGTGYAIGVHANNGKPWRIVVVSPPFKLLIVAKRQFAETFLKPAPVRVFDPLKIDKRNDDE